MFFLLELWDLVEICFSFFNMLLIFVVLLFFVWFVRFLGIVLMLIWFVFIFVEIFDVFLFLGIVLIFEFLIGLRLVEEELWDLLCFFVKFFNCWSIWLFSCCVCSLWRCVLIFFVWLFSFFCCWKVCVVFWGIKVFLDFKLVIGCCEIWFFFLFL